MATDKAITYLKNKAPKGEFLAYINKKEAAMLKKAGGSGELVNGIPSYRSKAGMDSKASSNKSSSKSSSKGGGGGNLGGGGGGQNTTYRSYRAPTKKTYTSKTIDSKPVTGNDYRDSRQQFIDKVNKDNRIAAAQNNTRFTPYQGGSRMQRSPGGLGNLLKLAIGGAFPGAGLLMGGLNKFGKMGKGIGEGITSLNDKIQNSDFGRSTSFADYRDIKSFGGYNEREMARQINKDEAKNLQARIDGGEFGGFGLQTPNYQTGSVSFDPSLGNRFNSGSVSFDPSLGNRFNSGSVNFNPGLGNTSTISNQPRKGIMQTISDAFFTPAGAAELSIEEMLNNERKSKGLAVDPLTAGATLNAGAVPDLSNPNVLNNIATSTGMPMEGVFTKTPTTQTTRDIKNIQDYKRNPDLQFNVNDIMGLDIGQRLGEPQIQSIFDMVQAPGQTPFLAADGGLASMFTRRR
jgi:hypothetical protein